MPPRKALPATLPAGASTKLIRVTRNVPAFSVGTIALRAQPIDEAPRYQLIGPPRSGFRFTDEERAVIESVAPSMPTLDPTHKIPVIDVWLAYLVEDYIERVKEATHSFNFKDAARELGVVANPGKGRRRGAAHLSEPVAHLLATRLLLRDGTTSLDAQHIADSVEAMRRGAFTPQQLQMAAREVRALGAPSPNRTWVPGTTTNEPLWYLGSHVLEAWQFGMKLDLRLYQDLGRDDGLHEGVHSEVVRLTQALLEIGAKRLSAEGFRKEDLLTRRKVFWSLVRIRTARQKHPSGCALRPAKRRSEGACTRAEDAMKRLSEQVLDARAAASDWVERGISRRRRPRSAAPRNRCADGSARA